MVSAVQSYLATTLRHLLCGCSASPRCGKVVLSLISVGMEVMTIAIIIFS